MIDELNTRVVLDGTVPQAFIGPCKLELEAEGSEAGLTNLLIIILLISLAKVSLKAFHRLSSAIIFVKRLIGTVSVLGKRG